MKLEIGEDRSPRFGTPVWESVWPVIVDGREVAEIIETEHGYRLRVRGVWVKQERPFRSQAEDDARNHCLPWQCLNSHPASGMRYEEAEINGVTWARVTVEGMVTHGPEARTEAVYAEFNRRYAAHAEKIEKQEKRRSE